jgi:hypothetical protein
MGLSQKTVGGGSIGELDFAVKSYRAKKVNLRSDRRGRMSKSHDDDRHNANAHQHVDIKITIQAFTLPRQDVHALLLYRFQ